MMSLIYLSAKFQAMPPTSTATIRSPITSVPCVKDGIRTRSSAVSFLNNRQSNNPIKKGNPTRANHPTRLRANQKNIRRTLLIAAAEHGKGA
jgi:hypothetical protein